MPGLTQWLRRAAYSPDGESLALVGIPTALFIVPLEGGGLPRRLTVEGMDDVAVYGGQAQLGQRRPVLYLAGRHGLLRIAPHRQRGRVAIADTRCTLDAVDVLPGAHARLVVMTARPPPG